MTTKKKKQRRSKERDFNFTIAERLTQEQRKELEILAVKVGAK